MSFDDESQVESPICRELALRFSYRDVERQISSLEGQVPILCLAASGSFCIMRGSEMSGYKAVSTKFN